MKEIKGRHGSAKVFADVLEDTAAEQIRALCDMEYAAESKIRIMPDVHAGAGCTIGTTMTIRDKVVPNLVGVDIGCGMETVILKERTVDLQALDRLICETIPSGFHIRKTPHSYSDEIDLKQLRCARHVNLDRAVRSIGTLGGGNHFIEVNRDEDGKLYVVVHSGSRHLGLETANYYQKTGWEKLNGSDGSAISRMIEEYKAQERQKEIQKAIEQLKMQVICHIPKALAYVDGQTFEDYIHDMKLVQRYAVLNRRAMIDEILRGLGLTVEDEFTTIHNYIDTENMILRKGAVSAQKGERLLIPMNMRDGSVVCVGKGNEDWNCSAPHGAGRIMSRTKAKQSFSLEEFKNEMKGIYTTSVNLETLDECPMAYKGVEGIIESIGPTAEIVKVLRPVYNFKAGGE